MIHFITCVKNLENDSVKGRICILEQISFEPGMFYHLLCPDYPYHCVRPSKILWVCYRLLLVKQRPKIMSIMSKTVWSSFASSFEIKEAKPMANVDTLFPFQRRAADQPAFFFFHYSKRNAIWALSQPKACKLTRTIFLAALVQLA